jgi:Bacterial Ig-like domain (group 3)
VAGATSSTYVVRSADAPSGLDVQIVANNVTGSALADSAATASVPRSTATTITSSANPAATGATVTLTASVPQVVNGGTLTITQNGQAIPGCPPITMTTSLIGVSCTGPFAQPGSYTITATYSGTSGWLGSSAWLTQTVTGSSTTPAAVGVAITANPSSLVNSPVIQYTESGPVTATLCTLDAIAAPCSSTQAAFTNLAGGTHVFAVTVSGAGGASALAQVTWTITTSTSTAKLTGRKITSHKKHKPPPKKHKPSHKKHKKKPKPRQLKKHKKHTG